MSLSISLVSGGDMVFSLTFDVGLTVSFAQVCFGSPAVGVGFWRLIGGSSILRTCPLILISFLEMADLDEEASSSAFDS